MAAEERTGAGRRVVYCIVPREYAAKLHETLRRHFRGDAVVEVVVEQRRRDRREGTERRGDGAAQEWLKSVPDDAERRRVRSTVGRRIAERRATVVPAEALELPRKARPYAERLTLVERVEPPTQYAEDVDTAGLVTRFQTGDRDAFADIYRRFFDRVYGYLLVVFRDRDAAEDGTQHVFTAVLAALPQYERRSQPFRAWLFVIVRNYAIRELDKRSRVEPLDPGELGRRALCTTVEETDLSALGWITDRDLVVLVERLPLPQRQVLLLRFMLGLTTREIATVLDRRPDDVRALQSRAMTRIRQRLIALGRTPVRRSSKPRMGRRREQAVVLRSRRFALFHR